MGTSFAYAHFHTVLILAETNPFSLFHYLSPPNKSMYISQSRHIRTHKSFWHLLCYAFFFLKVVENWDLPQSRKAGNHEDIWVRMQSEGKKEK